MYNGRLKEEENMRRRQKMMVKQIGRIELETKSKRGKMKFSKFSISFCRGEGLAVVRQAKKGKVKHL